MAEYTPANLQARMNEAGQTLETELGQDPAVAQARINYEKAQEALEQAQAHKNAVPYPGHVSKTKLAAWHAAVNGVQSAKVMLAEAEKAFRSAQNDAASARYSARMRADRNAQAEKRELTRAQERMVLRQQIYDAKLAVWPGTKASFEAAFYREGGILEQELTRLMHEAEAENLRQLPAHNAF